MSLANPVGMVTRYGYDDQRSNPAQNTYNLIARTMDVGASSHLNATTGYSYDAVGNLVGVVDPYGQGYRLCLRRQPAAHVVGHPLQRRSRRGTAADDHRARRLRAG